MAIRLQRRGALLRVEVPHVPELSRLPRRHRPAARDRVLHGVPADRDLTDHALGLEDRRDAGRAVAPIETREREALDVERVGEVDDVLRKRRLLRHSRRGRIAKSRGPIAAEPRHEHAMSGSDERRDDAVERSHVVGEAMQQNDRGAGRVAVLLVADLEHVGLHRARAANPSRSAPSDRPPRRRARLRDRRRRSISEIVVASAACVGDCQSANAELGKHREVCDNSAILSGENRDERACARRPLRAARAALPPGFAAVAIATIALAIGANTAMFSFVNGILLSPLPYPDPERIMRVLEKRPDGGNERHLDAELPRLGRAEHGLRVSRGANRLGRDVDRRRRAHAAARRARVDATTSTSRARGCVLGRKFLPGEDELGNDKVVLLSNTLWGSRFGADPGVVGRQITLNGEPHEIVGVLESSGIVRPRAAQIWKPLAFVPSKHDARLPLVRRHRQAQGRASRSSRRAPRWT